ncbi:phosphoethanolamine transferase [Pseudoxanthomonas wuyuanensis]
MNAKVLPARTPSLWLQRWPAWMRLRPEIGSEALILFCSAFFTLFYNAAFWHGAVSQPLQQWKWVLSLLLIVTAAHSLLLGLMVWRWSAKPLLSVLLLLSALAGHYMNAYGVYLDADMVRNVLHTDLKESREILSFDLLPPLLWALVPIALLWRIRLRARTPSRALMLRAGFLAAAVLTGLAGVLLSTQELSSFLRNHREVRYLVTPANVLVSLTKVMTEQPPGTEAALLPVGLDATGRTLPAGAKPRLLVMVVGETARAQNWGLNGYARQTTPELSQLPVVNFPHVTACGSSTEVSLPCMFSSLGREHYDEKRIRSQQSLLHVLDHAGVATLWRDNQSGCKGVCNGLAYEAMDDIGDRDLCKGSRCLDEVLLRGLPSRLAAASGDTVVVLHQLGNHGPNYFERYPPSFRRFAPVCETPELGKCESPQIVNAYDNALLYTDHFLARTIAALKEQPSFDAALIYVSDHGESLGEKGLYLHGMPYSIAPQEQTRVPMTMWFSPGFLRQTGLDSDCLRQHAGAEVSHDYLFHSVLGAMDVATALYRPERDLFASCRGSAAERSMAAGAAP